MNPITPFLTIVSAAAVVGHNRTLWGIPFVISAIVIASALKMANTS